MSLAETTNYLTPPKVIQAFSTALWAWCESADPSSDNACQISLKAASNGLPTLEVDGRLAHSSRDPLRESRRLVGADDGPLVIFGFGLGYTAEAALDLNPNRQVIIVERSRRLLKIAFQTRDLSCLLSQPEVFFVLGDSELLREALEQAAGQPVAIHNQAVCAPFSAWYKQAKAILEARRQREEVNAATKRRFGRRWVGNIARNLGLIAELPGVNHLANSFVGQPVLVIAAGPSLDQQLAYLPAFSQGCLLIVVDTAVRAVLNTGATPDFVIVVDPQYWNSRHLDHCEVNDCILISEAAVYPSVLRLTFAQRFLTASPYPLASRLEAAVDPKGALGAGGSVATTAWDFACLLGCYPIYLAGLDLAFPNLKTHFKGATFEDQAIQSAFRLQPAEMLDYQVVNDGFPFIAQGADGKAILSDKRLSLYAAWFEGRARRPKAPASYRLSPALAIEGFGTASPKELLALPQTRSKINTQLKHVKLQAEHWKTHGLETRQAALHQAVKTLYAELETYDKLLQSNPEAASQAAETASVRLITDFLVNKRSLPSEATWQQWQIEQAAAIAFHRRIFRNFV